MLFSFLFRYERSFILTGITLDETPLPAEPQEGAEKPDRQTQLLTAARDYVARLNPDLSKHKLLYARVLKSPAPYILEVECEKREGFVCLIIFSITFAEFHLSILRKHFKLQRYFVRATPNNSV
jgi:hypothetical protein